MHDLSFLTLTQWVQDLPKIKQRGKEKKKKKEMQKLQFKGNDMHASFASRNSRNKDEDIKIINWYEPTHNHL